MNLQADWWQALTLVITPWATMLLDKSWVGVIAGLLIAAIATAIFHRAGTHVLKRITAPLVFSRRLVSYGNRSGGVAVFLLLTQLILRQALDTLPGMDMIRHFNALLLAGTLSWFAVRCVQAIADTIFELNPIDTPDNLQARSVRTQTRVLARTAMTVIIVIGAGAAFMTVPVLRQIGGSLLASAGVAGLVVGFAARPVLSNLLAGIQIALTQPIRLDDVVIVENEWGWVEEITGTYVVVRIWDQRRLVLPLQWFIEHPFQNWTRRTAEILGSVLLWTDYRMPVDALRQEAERICRAAPEWDGRVCVTQVVDANEHAMQIRILVSAADAGRCWDLRCRVREQILHFLQAEYAAYLPRTRAEISADPAAIPPADALPDKLPPGVFARPPSSP